MFAILAFALYLLGRASAIVIREQGKASSDSARRVALVLEKAGKQADSFQVILTGQNDYLLRRYDQMFGQMLDMVQRVDQTSLLRKLGAEDFPVPPEAYVVSAISAWMQAFNCDRATAMGMMLQQNGNVPQAAEART